MLFRGQHKDRLIIFSFEDLKGWDDEQVYIKGQIPLNEVINISASVGKDKNGSDIFLGDVLKAPFGLFKVIPPDKEARDCVYCLSEGGKVGVFSEYAEIIGNEIETPGLFFIEPPKTLENYKV